MFWIHIEYINVTIAVVVYLMYLNRELWMGPRLIRTIVIRELFHVLKNFKV